MKKRICIVNKAYHPHIGGIETHVRDLALGLGEKYDITVLTSVCSRKTTIEPDGPVRVVRSSSMGTVSSAPLTLGFGYHLRRNTYDLVHVHFPDPVAVLSWLAVRPKARLLVTWHSDIVRQRWAMPFLRRPLNMFLDLASGIIATSAPYVDSSAFLSPRRGKVRVIPLGVAPERFEPSEKKLKRAALIRKKAGVPLVLFAGRLVYYKGVDILLKAIASIPGVHLAIVGEGVWSSWLRAMCVELKCEDRVSFFPYQDDENYTSFFHAADIVVLPSVARSEAFGLAQVEAHMAGKPVISTNLDTGVPWVNIHGKTGLIVPPSDPASLGRAISELLKNREQRVALGGQARLSALERFSLSGMLDATSRLWDELLQ